MKFAFNSFSYCKRRFLKCLVKSFQSPGFSCRRHQSQSLQRQRKVLGIETSCDDTGAAVVDEMGSILGEALNSQSRLSVE